MKSSLFKISFAIFFVIILVGIYLLQTSKSYKILGYPHQFSIPQGEPVNIHSSISKRFWPRYVKKLKIVNAVNKNEVFNTNLSTPIKINHCENFKEMGCNFPLTYKVDTTRFQAGLYILYFFDETYIRSHPIFFNVTPSGTSTHPEKHKDVAVLLPTFTWQAYNDIGGASFYVGNSPQPRRVSLLRPTLAPPKETLHNASSVIPFLELLSQNNLTYDTFDSMDLHNHNNDWLDKYKLLLIVTHDEYWSNEMRTHVSEFLRGGGKLAAFAGNTSWWKIQVSQNEIEVKNRIEGNPNNEKPGVLNNWYRLKQPEEEFLGLSFRFLGYTVKEKLTLEKAIELGLSKEEYNLSGGFEVIDPTHPIFENVKIESNKIIGANIPILHTEIDGIPLIGNKINYRLAPQAPPNARVLAKAVGFRKNLNRAGNIVEFNYGEGHVINFGSIGWYLGLKKKHKEIEQIFLNSINYMLTNDLGDYAN